jgi:hypothetical protein
MFDEWLEDIEEVKKNTLDQESFKNLFNQLDEIAFNVCKQRKILCFNFFSVIGGASEYLLFPLAPFGTLFEEGLYMLVNIMMIPAVEEPLEKIVDHMFNPEYNGFLCGILESSLLCRQKSIV